MTQYHFVNFFSPSEPDNSAKLGVIPASHTNIFLLGGMNEWMRDSCVPGGRAEAPEAPLSPAWHAAQHGCP